jgi:hypothetical protein
MQKLTGRASWLSLSSVKSQLRRLCNMKVEPGSKVEVQAECGIPLSDHELIKWQILNQDPILVLVGISASNKVKKLAWPIAW